MPVTLPTAAASWLVEKLAPPSLRAATRLLPCSSQNTYVPVHCIELWCRVTPSHLLELLYRFWRCIGIVNSYRWGRMARAVLTLFFFEFRELGWNDIRRANLYSTAWPKTAGIIVLPVASKWHSWCSEIQSFSLCLFVLYQFHTHRFISFSGVLSNEHYLWGHTVLHHIQSYSLYSHSCSLFSCLFYTQKIHLWAYLVVAKALPLIWRCNFFFMLSLLVFIAFPVFFTERINLLLTVFIVRCWKWCCLKPYLHALFR